MKILAKSQVSTDSSIISRYTTDWTGVYKGKSDLVLFPRTASDVAEILKICNKNNISLITVGGNTNLVGGCVPERDEIIMSTEKMNKFEFDAENGILTSEPGVILQTAQEVLHKLGFETPYNLGARGSCTIGGNIATNAGGINFIKYGSLRSYVLGLEVVLPNGDIVDMMKKISKDNTGLDLRQLFIGSEGSLGVITKANILCKNIPSARLTFMMRLKGFQNVVKILVEAKKIFGSHLNAIEYIDWESYNNYSEYKKDYTMPLEFLDAAVYLPKIYDERGKCLTPEDKEHFVLVEVSGGSEEQISELIEMFIGKNADNIEDSLMAQNEHQRAELWTLREDMVVAMVDKAKVLKYDISFDPIHFDELTQEVREKFHKRIMMTCSYGHIGDGNAHLQVMLPKESKVDLQLKHEIDDHIYNYVIKYNGSISAEHGIGMIKRDYLLAQKGQSYLDQVTSIKKLLDPNNILNPHKTIPM